MRKYLFFMLFILFSPNYSLADSVSLKISEVMYDFPGSDDGHEYIKIQNTGLTPIDITGYRFIDGGSTTKHAINLPPKNGSIGSPIIGSGESLILADNAVTYISDHPDYAGTVLDSTFSLINEGATVQLLDKDSNIVADYKYPEEVVVDPEIPVEDEIPLSDPIKLIINEIMYDVSGPDDGREWIEIYNAGSGDVDLTSLKLFEADTNHGITAVGNPVIAPGSFAIISSKPEQFTSDWPNYMGLVFDSTFSLSNTGESFSIKDADGNILDEVSYGSDQGGAGDDRSLQKAIDSWIEALPTPGQENKATAEPPPAEAQTESSSTQGSGNNTGGSSSPTKATTPKVPIIKTPKTAVKIMAPDYAIVGSTISLTAGSNPGKYVWNFGNGEVMESKNGDSVNYSYQYPGGYMITVNYFKDETSKPIKATAKIKAEDNPISIARVLEDGSIELKNEATHQEDISGWILKNNDITFNIPPETIFLPKSKIVFSSKLTKFNSGLTKFDLLYPAGSLADSFDNVEEKPELKSEPVLASIVKPLASVEPKNEPQIEQIKQTEQSVQVKGVELAASVQNAVPENQSEPILPWVLGLGGIILFSSVISFSIFSSKAASAAKGLSSGFKLID